MSQRVGTGLNTNLSALHRSLAIFRASLCDFFKIVFFSLFRPFFFKFLFQVYKLSSLSLKHMGAHSPQQRTGLIRYLIYLCFERYEKRRENYLRKSSIIFQECLQACGYRQNDQDKVYHIVLSLATWKGGSHMRHFYQDFVNQQKSKGGTSTTAHCRIF